MESDKRRRMTRQRQVILDELSKVTSHPSADEVYRMVRRRLPRISMGTVYRNLEILSSMGMIQKLVSGGSLMRFDANAGVHYHIRCVGCDRVVDAPVAPLIKSGKAIRSATDYKIVGHRFEFLGVCPICSKTAIAPGLKNARYLTRTSRN